MKSFSDRRSSQSSFLLFLLGLIQFVGTLHSQEPKPPTGAKAPLSTAEDVIFLTGDAAKLIQNLPNKAGMVLLSKEKYEAMLKQLKTLQNQQPKVEFLPVSYATVTGKVTTEAVELVVTLKLRVEEKEGYVLLGRRRIEPTSVQLDDETPLLLKGSKGLLLKVHHRPDKTERIITLRMKSRLREISSGVTKELREGFEIDLPEAGPGVKLSNLQLPPNVLDVHVNDEQPDSLKGNLVSRNLGNASSLKVTWLKRTVPGQTTPMRTVLGTIDAWVDSSHLTTKTSLILKSGGQPVDQWQLYVPASAKLSLSEDQQAKGIQITRERGKAKTSLITVRFPKPSTATLPVLITDRQPIVKGELPPLGPFTVLRAASQRGTLRFHGASHQWVHCSSSQAGRSFHVEVLQRKPTASELQADSSLISIFDYWAQAEAGEQSDVTSTWLTPRLSHARGRVKATLLHGVTLSLLKDGRPEWRLRTSISVEPGRLGVDRLTVNLPEPWSLIEPGGIRPAELISSSFPEGRALKIRLTREQTSPFTLELEARHVGQKPLLESEPVEMPLPQLAKDAAWDRGRHEIQIDVPDQMEIIDETPEDPDVQVKARKPDQVIWSASRFPENLKFRWRTWRPQLRVNSIVDIDWRETHVVVRQQWLYPSDGSFPNEVALIAPLASLLGPPETISGEPVNTPVQRMPLPAEAVLRYRPVVEPTRQRSHLELEYAFAVPKNSDGNLLSNVTVPLIRPANVTHGWIRVRTWSSGGAHINGAEQIWQPQPLEKSSRHRELPTWVGLASSPSAPLILKATRVEGRSPITIERALYQVRLMEGGLQKHQARFRLRTDGQSPIHLELPASPAALRLQVFFNDKPAPAWQPDPGGKRNIIHLPPLESRPGMAQVLMIQCQMTSTRENRVGSFQTTIQPVRVINNEAPYPVRWQIDLPEGQSPITWTGSEQDSWSWTFRGVLLAPVPRQNAEDLERWFVGDMETGVEEQAGLPSIVSARARLHPMTITHVPQQGWLMVCSLGILMVGLALYFLPLGRSEGASRNRYFWPMVTLLGLIAAGASVVYPRLFASIAQGAQPGVVVLMVTLFAHWLWIGRRQRRVMMMPGFRQGKRPSGSGSRPRGEGEGASTTSHVPLSALRNSSVSGRVGEPPTDPPQPVSGLPNEPQEGSRS